jgi:hypothetical protein
MVLAGHAEALAYRERAGEHVRSDVARREHGVEVQRVGQLAVGECGTEHRHAMASTDDRGVAAAPAGHLTILDANPPFGCPTAASPHASESRTSRLDSFTTSAGSEVKSA